MNCPICNNKELQLSDTFCPICGFEVHILPDNVSDAVKEYEKNREIKYKDVWETINKNQKTIDEIEKQRDELNDRNQRLVNDNNRLESDLNEALSRPVEEPIQGFLVVGMDEETWDGKTKRVVKDVIPVYSGKNVIGKMPIKAPDVHIYSILFGDGVQKEHIMIESKTDNSFIVHNISGTSYIRNDSNILNGSAELYNEDDIFIGNIVLTFVNK